MVNKREHPKKCPTCGSSMWYTTSRDQLVCTSRVCDHYEAVEEEVVIPKAVARAIRMLRKRTRRMLRKQQRSE